MDLFEGQARGYRGDVLPPSVIARVPVAKVSRAGFEAPA
jgi:hypothetical protein